MNSTKSCTSAKHDHILLLAVAQRLPGCHASRQPVCHPLLLDVVVQGLINDLILDAYLFYALEGLRVGTIAFEDHDVHGLLSILLHHEDAVPHADVAVDFHEWQAYGVYRQLVLGARLQRVEHLDGRGVPL